MTELHPKAKALLRVARDAQDPTSDELDTVLRNFHDRKRRPALFDVSHAVRAAHEPARIASLFAGRRGTSRLRNHAVKWALLTAIMTGSLGAFANWGTVVKQVNESWNSLLNEVFGAPSAGALKPTQRGAAPRLEAQLAAELDRAAPPGAQVDAPVDIPPPSVDALEASTPAVSSTLPSSPVAAGLRAEHARLAPTAARARVRVPPAASPLEREVNLIAAARSALIAGNYPRLGQLLDEHATLFPNGTLAEERETLRALAACRRSGSVELARRYVERRPQSLFTPRLLRECGLATDTQPP